MSARSPRHITLPEPDCLLSLGGYRIRIERAAPGPEMFLPVRYAPFVESEAGPADLVVRAYAGVDPPGPAGEVRFAHRPLWVLREEPGGIRRYEAMGRTTPVLRAMRIGPDSPVVELYGSPGRATEFRDHPQARWVLGTLLDDPLDQLLFVDRLTEERAGLVLHGAAIARGEAGYVFAGVSGRGKSTLSRAVRGGRVLTDDRAIVRSAPDGSFAVHGSPWYGEVGLKSAGSAKLAAIYLIDRESPPGVAPLEPKDAFRDLLHVAFPTYWDRCGLEFALEFLQRLVDAVPVGRLSFARGEDVLDRIHGQEK